MSAFALFGFPGTEKWQEEVKLSDGRVIVVKREIVFEQGGDEWSSNRSGMKPKEYRISFEHPDKPEKVIEWRSTKKSPGTWPETPLILDMDSGSIVIYTIVGTDKTRCECYSKYIYSVDGPWVDKPLPDLFETQMTNLFLRLGENMPKYVDLETKQKNNREIGYRRSIRQVGPKREVCSK